MPLNRREFIVLTATVASGCTSEGGGAGSPAASAHGPMDAGPVGNFADDRVYASFRDQGFFLIRRGGQLRAISSVCTHRRCELDLAPDQSFYCKCHGSTFDRDGKVTKGPARRDLPTLPIEIDERGRLIVRVPVAS